eukprot:211600_1
MDNEELTWSSNVKEILDQDEKIFFNEVKRKSLMPTTDDMDDKNVLNLSTLSLYHQYFSKRSPAVTEIFESDDEINYKEHLQTNQIDNIVHKLSLEIENISIIEEHKHNNDQIEDDSLNSLISFPSR